MNKQLWTWKLCKGAQCRSRTWKTLKHAFIIFHLWPLYWSALVTGSLFRVFLTSHLMTTGKGSPTTLHKASKENGWPLAKTLWQSMQEHFSTPIFKHHHHWKKKYIFIPTRSLSRHSVSHGSSVCYFRQFSVHVFDQKINLLLRKLGLIGVHKLVTVKFDCQTWLPWLKIIDKASVLKLRLQKFRL